MTTFNQVLDSVPIGAVFAIYVVAAILIGEGGFRVGRWWQRHTQEVVEGSTGMIVGSLLATMAFLLAIAMGMASERFDTRRGLVLSEANSIGTTYLRSGYLPAQASEETRKLLREYVNLRVSPLTSSDIRAKIARSEEIHALLWSIAEELARATPESDMIALYIDSLNQTIDLHETRIAAGIYARVPVTVLALLILGSTLTLGMVGYNSGLTLRRSSLTGVVLILVLAAVITLVIDLDRPRDGFLKVSQQPLIDLQKQIGAG